MTRITARSSIKISLKWKLKKLKVFENFHRHSVPSILNLYKFCARSFLLCGLNGRKTVTKNYPKFKIEGATLPHILTTYFKELKPAKISILHSPFDFRFRQTLYITVFTRLRSRRVVMCLVVVYARSFVPSYNRRYFTYFDQTWNIERRKYREGSRLYYIELRHHVNF